MIKYNDKMWKRPYLGYEEGDEDDNMEVRNELKQILNNCKNETTIKYLTDYL